MQREPRLPSGERGRMRSCIGSSMRLGAVVLSAALVLVGAGPSQAQAQSQGSSVAVLTSRICGSSWSDVRSAALSLALRDDTGAVCIALADLCESKRVVELTIEDDTWHLGSLTPHSHGYAILYDLNVIGVRAGWLLEWLTFEDFGWGQLASSDPAFASEVGAARRRVRSWRQELRSDWSRKKGLVAALMSTNPIRQNRALLWLQNHGDGLLDPKFGYRFPFGNHFYQRKVVPWVRYFATKRPFPYPICKSSQELAQHLLQSPPPFE